METTSEKQDFTKELLSTVQALRHSLKERLDTQENLRALEEDMKKKETEYIKQANEAVGEDGKKRYTNEAMRKAFVEEQMATHDWSSVKNLQRILDKTDVEIRCLDYEFQAFKTIVKAKAVESNLESLQGAMK